jgi:hypothetical protein
MATYPFFKDGTDYITRCYDIRKYNSCYASLRTRYISKIIATRKIQSKYRDIFLTLNIVHTYSLCSILKNTDQCIVSCYATNYTEHQRF